MSEQRYCIDQWIHDSWIPVASAENYALADEWVSAQTEVGPYRIVPDLYETSKSKGVST